MQETLADRLRLTGHFPGALGLLTELHARYYAEHWGFDLRFETQVGRELSEFMARFAEGRDGFWTAFADNRFAGGVAVDGQGDPELGARLRWFIVEPRFQGLGLGGLLLAKAMDFCGRAGHGRVHLWTFRGLDGARALYERHGFVLREEHPAAPWGPEIMEQLFVREEKQTKRGDA
ncbi:MAG TPA: GNAT family N-acetyltransferase [Desulfovibrio sp.]|nr:GNAT family N-acetyltransferase [Desulfovibrio sp.]